MDEAVLRATAAKLSESQKKDWELYKEIDELKKDILSLVLNPDTVDAVEESHIYVTQDGRVHISLLMGQYPV